MANNKNFITKNPIEISKDLKISLGTISSSTLDLSTGNYFNDTLSSNTTYAFSNSDTNETFQLEVTGGPSGISSLLDPAPTYASKTFRIETNSGSPQETNPNEVTFNSNGTKMFAIGATNDKVYEYTLSTAYDVSTASYNNVNFSVSAQETVPKGLTFKPDGTKMFIIGTSSDTVFQYGLSTAFDLSTASYDNVSFDVGLQETQPQQVVFKPDGTRMFIAGQTGDDITQYDLSTAWDITTASDSGTLSISSQFTNPTSLAFRSDGKALVVVGTGSTSVFQYTLTNPWDVSSGSYASLSFNAGSQASSNLQGIYVDDAANVLYITALFAPLSANDNSVFQYTIDQIDATIAWPTSVKWLGGTPPYAPTVNKKDIYTFSTKDGGTTYLASYSIENVS